MGGNGALDADLQGVSQDGSRAWFITTEGLAAADADGGSIDVYEWRDGTVTLVSIGSFATAGTQAEGASFLGASVDGSHVYFVSDARMEEEDGDTSTADVWERFNGQTRLVSIGAFPGSGTANFPATFKGVSDDGSRVFFETIEKLEATDGDIFKSDVYMRFGGATTLISTGSFTGAGTGSFDATFDGAAAGGTIVFFTTTEKLESDDLDTSDADVYSWEGGVSTLLSKGSLGASGDRQAFFGGASKDGSKVFFNSTEALEPGDGDSNGRDVYERSGGATTLLSTGTDNGAAADAATYVGSTPSGSHVYFTTKATLSTDDNDVTGNDIYERSGATTRLISTGTQGGSDTTTNPFYTSVSDDGSRVTFDSALSLEPEDADTNQRDVWQRVGNTTTLVSLGDNVASANAAFASGSDRVSPDGLRVLFDSPVPHNVDDTDTQADLFLWVNGNITRVSAGPEPGMGNGAFGAFIEAASRDLSRIYFETSEALDTRDTDANRDVYAWRSVAIGFGDGAFAVEESAGSTAVPVAIAPGGAGPVTVAYQVTGGTAAAGSDFTLPAGSLEMDPFQSSVELPLTVIQDANPEANENILVTLSAPKNAGLGTAVATITIQDDDPRFVKATSSVSEKTPVRSVAVARPDIPGGGIAVGYRVTGGTAKSPADFLLPPGTLVFAPGDTAQDVEIAVKQDFLVEKPETVVIALHVAGSPGTVIATHTVTITDDEPKVKCGRKTATMVGSQGSDALVGTNSNDVIVGRGGHDIIAGLKGKDIICSGGGNDNVDAGSGDDIVLSAGGDDLVRGGDGRDLLTTGGGSDVLIGGPGNGDRCEGGNGVDVLGPAHGCETIAGVP